MKIKISRAIQQNACYAIGIITMKSISLFMLPFIAHALSTEDFGRLEILSSFGSVGAILVGFGLLNTLFRFAGDNENEAKNDATCAEIFGINVFIGVFGLLVGLSLCDWLNANIPGQLGTYNIRIMVGMIALEGCISIPLGWLRMKDKAVLFLLITVMRASVQALLTVYFIVHERGVEGMMEAGLIAAFLQACILFIIQLKHTGITFNASQVYTYMTYSTPLVGSGLLAFMLNGLDRWILADAIGTADMAIYAIAAKFSLISALLLQPFLMWWSPRRFQVLQEPNGISKAANFAALGSGLSALFAVFVGLTAPIVIQLLLPVNYWHASQYVPWLVLTVVIKDTAELLNLGCFTGKSTTTQFSINLCASIVGVIGMLFFIPKFHIWGLIGALLGAQMARLCMYLYFSQRHLYLPYPVLRLIPFIVSALGLLFWGSLAQDLVTRVLVLFFAVLILTSLLFTFRLVPVSPLTMVK